MSSGQSDDLNHLRSRIDQVDAKLIQVLKERFELVEKIGQYKKQHNLPALNQTRWLEVLAKLEERAKEEGLDYQTLEEIWNIIHKYSIKIEEKI